MRKNLLALLLAVLFTCMTCCASSEDSPWVENKSPELIQNAAPVIVSGSDVFISPNQPAVSFTLLKNAIVKAYAEAVFHHAQSSITGHGLVEGTLWITPQDGISLSSGSNTLQYVQNLFINAYEEEGGESFLWPTDEYSDGYAFKLYLEAVEAASDPSDDDPNAEEPDENTPDEETEDELLPVKPACTWYPNNTVGLVGLSLRDNFPGLTDKWYNIVPVDLTQNGVQTFRLVASNLFYIGQAAVIVDGDNVTVQYALANGHGYVKDECVRWFTSVDEITSDFLKAPESGLAFDQTISRSKDLNGQDVALLFICNHVTYRQPYTNSGVNLTRYWPNLDEWKAYREGLNALMERLPE